MAPSQNRKRHRDQEPLQDLRPTKAQRTGNPLQDKPPVLQPHLNVTLRNLRHWVYPPKFWDNLSTIALTRSALREFDRRSRRQHISTPPSPRPTSFAPDVVRTLTRTSAHELTHFARHGGPDLSTLRGYPEFSKVTRNHLSPTVMAPATRSLSRPAESTRPTTVGNTRKSSAYDACFRQHLIEHGIRPCYSDVLELSSYSEEKDSEDPENPKDPNDPKDSDDSHVDRDSHPELYEVRKALKNTRSSLSPPRFSRKAFKRFIMADTLAKNETEVLHTVIPCVTGGQESNSDSGMDWVFNNLEALTDGSLVAAKPDFFYGSEPTKLDRPIREELGPQIIPSTTLDRTILPNFFLEVKGRRGTCDVAMEQARYDGSLGARGMHVLQNYGRREPVYDGKPCAYSSIYIGGSLELYAHRVTAPETVKDGEPKYSGRKIYHMTSLASYSIKNDHETFRAGVSAFRNLRDFAREQRLSCIKAANLAYRQARRTSGRRDSSPAEELEGEDGDHEQPPSGRTRRRAAEPADAESDGTAKEPEDVEDTPEDTSGDQLQPPRRNPPQSRPVNKRQRV